MKTNIDDLIKTLQGMSDSDEAFKIEDKYGAIHIIKCVSGIGTEDLFICGMLTQSNRFLNTTIESFNRTELHDGIYKYFNHNYFNNEFECI